MKLSIIIPVYNTENYLVRCLDSCLQQDIPAEDYEIIAVNDGSTDGSLALLQQYAERYSNVRVFSQENQKQGAARNLGIRHAKGEYIWFVDSDDYVAKNCLGGILQSVDEHHDLFHFPGSYVDKGNGEISYSPGISKFPANLYDTGVRCVAPWCYIFRRSFLEEKGLCFMPNVFFEDNDFTSRVIYHARSSENIGRIDKPVYYVSQRETSTTRSYNKNKQLDIYKVAVNIYEYKRDHVKDPHWSVFFNRYIRSAVNSYMMYNVLLGGGKNGFAELRDNPELQHEMQYGSAGSRLKMALLRRCPSALYLLLKMESAYRKAKARL